jgi:hypothetical protein
MLTMSFPVVVCLVGAISTFWVTIKLRSFKVGNKPPTSRSHLSLEERQRKIRIASWISFGMACVFVVGAILLEWLEHIGGRISN